MGQNITDKSFENPLKKLLAQANEQAQKDQRLPSDKNKKEMNTQELLLMQMLKSSSLETHDEPQTKNEFEDSNDKFIKIRYEPKFLFKLEKSPLVMPPSYWESEIPPIEFFRLNKLSNESRRERRRSSNARRGSALKKEKELIDDLKKENNNRNNGAGREDRRTQRARQRENKKRGKFDTSAIEEGDEYGVDTPEWMKEQDETTGNSMLDFEIWRLKMRIETARRNGEDVNPDDMAEYAKLKSQLVSDDTKNIETRKEIKQEEKEVDILGEKSITDKHENEAKTIILEEKLKPSVDDQFALPLPSNTTATTGTTSSHFSSFFSSEKSVEPLQNESTKRSSRLISILSDENLNSDTVPKSPLQSSIQQTQGTNNFQQSGFISSGAHENVQSDIINNTAKQFPMMMPMANSIPNDKHQLFLQSLLSRTMVSPNQGSNIQINPNINQQFSQQAINQRLPNGMDPRVIQGFPPNMNHFSPNIQMQMPVGIHPMQPPQLSTQQSSSPSPSLSQEAPLSPQNKNDQRQLGPNRQTITPNNMSPQQQQSQNLPYGNNSGNVQGMTPNHPLMMLLNKNKRKSSQDIQTNIRNSPTNSPPNNNSSMSPQSQNLVNQQRNINNIQLTKTSNIPNMPVVGNNQMTTSEFGNTSNMPMYSPMNGMNMNGINMNGMNMNGINMNGMNMNGMNINGMNINGMNINGINMNGMNINGMNMNGINMNGINMINPQNIQQNVNSVNPPINHSQTPF